MVADAYEAILEELGKIYQVELHPDAHQTCLINFQGIHVQIELFNDEDLLMGSDLGEVPTGKYRENLFREAMRINGMPSPLNGILSFSTKSSHLILFERLPIRDLNGERVAAALIPFLEKAKVWKEALENGNVPVISGPSSSGGIFGLKT